MLTHLYSDKDDIVRLASSTPLKSDAYKHSSIETDQQPKDLVGRKLNNKQKPKQLKVAYICNWADQCGISFYSQWVINSLKDKIGEFKIFSEYPNMNSPANHPEYDIEYCWHRNESKVEMAKKVIAYEPDVVLIQHEYGLFPRGNHFLTMMHVLKELPVVVTMHSVYEHGDKSVCTSAMRNVIVHSDVAKRCLTETLGHKNQNVYVVHHGFYELNGLPLLWNFYGEDAYPVIQFGFGFGYKGVDVALRAIKYLKDKNPLFKNIFYQYLCSEAPHAKGVNTDYYNKIRDLIVELDLEDNASVQLGFFSETELSNQLRTARLAVFPYVVNPSYKVYGSSAACRVAIANGIPTIVSDSEMFDDLENVLPRPKDYRELGNEIEKVFTDPSYRDNLIAKQSDFAKRNDWNVTADRYLAVLNSAIDDHFKDTIFVTN